MYHVLYLDQDGDLSAAAATEIYMANAPEKEIRKMKAEDIWFKQKSNGNEGTPKTIYFHLPQFNDEYFCVYHLDLSSANIGYTKMENQIRWAFEHGRLDLTPYGICIPDE